MKQSNSTLKKIDIFWAIFSIVSLSIFIYYLQTGKDYFFPIWFLVLGLVFSIKLLISKILFNVLRVLLSLGMLYYILKYVAVII